MVFPEKLTILTERTRNLPESRLQELYDAGLHWIRPVIRPWAQTLRDPTVGVLVELTAYEDVGSMRLGTRASRRLLGRIASRC